MLTLMHTHYNHIQLVSVARIVETNISLAMPARRKCGADVGKVEQRENGSWRAHATGSEGRKRGPLRPCKYEALADLSKAKEGAANSTDVARGLVALMATRNLQLK